MLHWPQFRRRKIQDKFDERRKFIRLDTNIPIQYSVIPKDKEKEIKKHKFYGATTKNIGGGGLLVEIPVLTDEILLTTHLIKVKFTLSSDTEPIDAVAKMVCVEKPEHIEGFYLRLSFIKISKDDQQKLINYVREKHKKSRQ